MLPNIISYIPPITGIIIISSFVLIRNKTLLFRLFATVTLLIALWQFFQFLTAIFAHSSSALLLIQIGTVIPNFLVVAFVQFCAEYTNRKISNRKLAILLIPAILITPFSFTGDIISSVKPSGNSFETIVGPLYLLQTVFLVGFFIYALSMIIKEYRKTTGIRKTQTGMILLSFFIPIIIVLITGFVFVENATAQLIGPSAFLLMAAMLAYAIIRHKLFDIRLIVARSIGYLLTLFTFVGFYVLLVSGVSFLLSGSTKINGAQQLFNIGATLVFGLSLLPLKRFFDKLTNRFFYRDAYDAQELLDKLNKILVGNIELDILLKQTSDLIALTLKAEYTSFIIRKTEGTAQRASFSKIVKLNTDQVLELANIKKGKTELFVADDLDQKDNNLRILKENNIALAASLVTSGANGADQGFLLLGPKLSGNPYNKQDLQVLDIIANELVIAIQNALRFEEIETFNITLQEKVNDATRKLRQTNEKLKEIDETKDEFISMASHQLRTPLTSVKGYVSMVVEGDAGKLNKQQRELLGQAFASSQRMVYLIADLLNVSRLKTGKFVIENKPTQLADVIESEMQQLTETAKTKDQILTYNKPAKFPVLNMDETKIRQVIMNFTDNALHYTPNGGHIQVNLADKGDQIEFTVVDDGLGVPKAEQHHLFTKFYRANNAKKARPDGTGLGLFMAKKVIIAQGGAVIFQSTENKGSTFGFTFPKSSLKATDSSIKSSVKSLDEAITK